MIGFVVGLGFGSLIGQRTVAVVIMIVLEIVLTPILSRARIPHLSNLQRAVVGLATAHLAPGGLPVLGGGGTPAGGSGIPYCCFCCLRHRCVAAGLVNPRGRANDDPRRLRTDALT